VFTHKDIPLLYISYKTTYFQNIHYPIFLKFSPLEVELIRFYFIISCNFFELLLTSIYDLNKNVNSRRHNFLYCMVKLLEISC